LGAGQDYKEVLLRVSSGAYSSGYNIFSSKEQARMPLSAELESLKKTYPVEILGG